jgi:hypothetical protein
VASIRLGVFAEVRDATDVPEVSGARNSIGAQEFGADFTEPYRVRGFDLRLERRSTNSAIAVSLGVAREWTEAVKVEAVPAQGTFRPVPAVPTSQGWRADLALSVAPRALSGGLVHGSLGVQVRRLRDAGDVPCPCAAPHASSQHPSDRNNGCIHVRRDRNGGRHWFTACRRPIDAPGYGAHQFAPGPCFAAAGGQFPIPPSIPVGRWGRSPGRATVAPLTAIVVQEERGVADQRHAAGYLSVGAGLLVFFDLVRFDVARGLRNGRWTFGVDLSRDLWRIL